ncbi:hypothetical protein LU631_22605 [Erwinia tracheiphila]|nr:hypothetical protein [Erwinia tracheiphila]EOS95039.1 membrane transport protein [Erwinia tracheiphila PSU-1]UIA84041.1 hypothetical protein LU604_02880 [Erwinia tracheiphila]UIA87460.1 hypothetical protein LU631_22605 [Erwinia tracheiphila]UIA92623.1 hypothetical protein LU632_02850 [Erwinia tracheiphila]UIA95826.1 hypothetical protein LU633_21050 [Erwinia tracheiphila]
MEKSRLVYALIPGALNALGPLCTDFYLSALPELTCQFGESTSPGQLTAALAELGAG